MGYTLDQLQSMGAQPVTDTPSAGYTLEDLQKMGATPVDEPAPPAPLAPTPPPPTVKPPSALDVLFGPTIGAAKSVANTAVGLGKMVVNAGKLSGDTHELGRFAPEFTGENPRNKAANSALDSVTLEPNTGSEKVGYYGSDIAQVALPAAGIAKTALTLTKEESMAKAAELLNKALGSFGKKSVSGLINNDAQRVKGLETLYTLSHGKPIAAPDGTTFNFDSTKISDPTELLQAFRQAKQDTWARIESGLEKGSDITPDYSAVKAALQEIITSKGSTAQATNHAANRLAEINNLETGTVKDSQNYLQQLNSRLGSTFNGASDAIPNKIDAQVVGGVNHALDTALSNVKDGAIRPFKDQYAALKSIEPDLVKMVQKTVRKTGGIPQYLNDFGNIDILDAVLSHNPGLFVARGVMKKVMSKVLESQRNPLDNLSKAFEQIKGYLGDTSVPPEPPMLALPPGTRGTGPTVNSGPALPLPERAQSTIDAAERSNPAIKLPQQEPQKLLSAPGENPIQLPAGQSPFQSTSNATLPTNTPVATESAIPSKSSMPPTLPSIGGSASAAAGLALPPLFQSAPTDPAHPFPQPELQMHKSKDPLSYVRQRPNPDVIAKNLPTAIMLHESGGKQVKGASGEAGAFQFLPATWTAISKEVAGKVLPQTAQNEKSVATAKIASLYQRFLKETGDALAAARKTALVWNTSLGGTEKPLVTKGVNKKGVKFDSGAYADAVMSQLAALGAVTGSSKASTE